MATSLSLRSEAAPRPAAHAVLLEQVRAVGLALRREGLIAAALLGLAAILVLIAAASGTLVLSLEPDEHGYLALFGLLLPFAVWKGERMHGVSPLWTLPVDQRLHALAKVAAGWFWLMAGIAGYVLVLAALAWLTGGEVGVDEMRRMTTWSSEQELYAQDPATLPTVHWSTPAWQWLMPFTAATLFYLFGSALRLATARPLRWVARGVAILLISGVAVPVLYEAGATGLSSALAGTLESIMARPSGLLVAVDGFRPGHAGTIYLDDGTGVTVWRGLPALAEWGRATLIWLGVGLILLAGATFRRRHP